jgi:autotransporter-associated beta strand protein
MRHSKSILTFLALSSIAPAQTAITLNGASGSVSHATARSTNGGLSIGLGFEVEYLVVGGGGGGGNGYDSGPGGGGGAGGLTQGSLSLGSGNHSVTVGAGGAGGGTPGVGGSGVNGGNSSFGDITMLGGGGGGASRGSGLAGGSGGGAGGRPLGGDRTGGGGTSGYGNDGGDNLGAFSGSISYGGSGGGGALSAGQSRTSTSASTNAGIWGEGITSSIDGTSRQYAFGGYGGYANFTSNGTNATIIGSGGAGASINQNGISRTGGSGSTGAVIVRYLGAAAGTGGTVSSSAVAGYTVHSFLTSGSSSLDLSGLNLNSRLGAVENGVISGSGDLTFTGPGTMTLNAANTYSGRTHISAGTLALGSSGSIANSSGVNIATGANFNVTTVVGGFTLGAEQNLSGGGTITGDVTISGSHTPGFSPGVQSFADDLTYTVGSSVVWELIDNTIAGRGTNYDGINVGGDLSFTGSTTINLDFALAGSTVNWTDSFWDTDITGTSGWKLFDVNGSISGFEDNLQLAAGHYTDGSLQSLTSVRSDASFYLYKANDGIYLNYSAVPEPSAAVLAALSAIGLLRRKRS